MQFMEFQLLNTEQVGRRKNGMREQGDTVSSRRTWAFLISVPYSSLNAKRLNLCGYVFSYAFYSTSRLFESGCSSTSGPCNNQSKALRPQRAKACA